MLTYIEEDLFKIIHPIFYTDSTGILDLTAVNLSLISSRETLDLINNLKSFVKGNLCNPSLFLILSKYLSTLFSKILFRLLEHSDESIRIAADECINLFIRLTSFHMSSYIIYNIFVEFKQNGQWRSFNAALYKFSNLCFLIKPSKRTSYVNNVLPALRNVAMRTEESVLIALTKALPKIAENLFSYAPDADIESAVLVALLNNMKSTVSISNQRNIAQMIAITCFYMKNSALYVKKLFQYFLAIKIKTDENELRSSVFVFKSLLSTFSDPSYRLTLENPEMAFVLFFIVDLCEQPNCGAGIKNIALDCLVQILQILHTLKLHELVFSETVDRYQKFLSQLNSELIFEMNYVEKSPDPDELKDNTEIGTESLSLTTTESSDQLGTDSLRSFEIESQSEMDLSDMDNLIVYECNQSLLLDDELPLADQTDSVIDPGEVNVEDFQEEEPTDRRQQDFTVNDLGLFVDWNGTVFDYLVKLLLTEFLPDSIPNESSLVFFQQRTVRVSSKVLALSCLSHLACLEMDSVVNSISIVNNKYRLPSAVSCAQTYYNDEDAQLSGAAYQLLGNVVVDQINNRKSFNEHDAVENLIWKIRTIVNNPNRGQHLKFILVAIKSFLWSLTASDHGEIAIALCDSILDCVGHSYKLVRREVLMLCRCIDFRNIAFLMASNEKFGLFKRRPLAQKSVDTVLTLLADVEPDIREEACQTMMHLISNGAFDNPSISVDCYCVEISDDYSCSSFTDYCKVLAFVPDDINIKLETLRKKLILPPKCLCSNKESVIQVCVNLIIRKLINNPTACAKEMKNSQNSIAGCIRALICLLDQFPLSTYSDVWLRSGNNSINSRSLLSYCLSLFNTQFIMSDIAFHADLINITSRLLLYNGLDELLSGNLLNDKNQNPTSQNVTLESNLIICIRTFMTHVTRVMNIFWHLFQFITPSVPAHKTVLPNLSSQSHPSPARKKQASSTFKVSNQVETHSADSRPPRTKASVGYFVSEPHYMHLYKSLSIAYNSYIISFDYSNNTDRLLALLQQTIYSFGFVLEYFSFTQISLHTEELLSYTSLFYNFLPEQTVYLIIKLLGALFGTNVLTQWDPFISQVYKIMAFKANVKQTGIDIPTFIIDLWRSVCERSGSSLQMKLRQLSVTNMSGDSGTIDKWHFVSDLFPWIKFSGKKREPGILRHVRLSDPSNRPNLGRYIGLFEKHVFQCMRHYLTSPVELQLMIIKLLVQLIYLRVNYCQLDSEQKFVNIILSQLESFTSANTTSKCISSLILEIIEFLLLLTYEKANNNKKDQPIMNVSQIIHSIESLIANGVSMNSIVLPCFWKIVCDLYVNRTAWLSSPSNFNVLPNANAAREVETQRDYLLDIILRRLVKYPESFEMISLIVEQAAREHEVKWDLLSNKIWNRLSSVLFEDCLEFSEPSHIEMFDRLTRLLSIKAITHPGLSKGIVDLILKFDPPISSQPSFQTKHQLFKLHAVQAARSFQCLKIMSINKFDYLRDYKCLSADIDDPSSARNEFCNRIIENFRSLLLSYKWALMETTEIVSQNHLYIILRILKSYVLFLIDLKTENNTSIDVHLFSVPSADVILGLDEFINPNVFDKELLFLWNELKFEYLMFSPDIIDERMSPIARSKLAKNVFIQFSRFLLKTEKSNIIEILNIYFEKYFIYLILFQDNIHVKQVISFISQEEKFSQLFLDVSLKHLNEITINNKTLMKWLCLLEGLHYGCTEKLIISITTLFQTHPSKVTYVVSMKIESLIENRLSDLESSPKEDYDRTELDELLSRMESLQLLGSNFPYINKKEHKRNEIHSMFTDITDPLVLQDSNLSNMTEKKFWKLCIENSLQNHDLDVRLCPRLLQGGTSNDVESIFQITVSSVEVRSRTDLGPQQKFDESKEFINLPPRFIQQCIRLGFLRSGGGVVQEGVKIDLIFRLGEKLLFQQIGKCLDDMKMALDNKNFSDINLFTLIGLLSGLNDYLSLSCQLAVPLPVSIDVGYNITKTIECLSTILTLSKELCSRILIEELLSLITTCFGSFTLLTDEGMKNLGCEITPVDVANTTDFLLMVTEQYSPNPVNLSGDKIVYQTSCTKSTIIISKVIQIFKFLTLHEIDNCSRLQTKLKAAVITVARLPCFISYTRNPKYIKDPNISDFSKLFRGGSRREELELNCLSKLNRDDLLIAQTILNNLGWINRHMFEETWLIYLNLLHDKGPSAALNDSSVGQMELNSEEIVEQGHCDSLGLLGLTDLLLRTTGRPNPGNPIVSQLEHKPRDKTPNLLHTKIGRKLSYIHAQLEEEIFLCLRGFKMLTAGWTISSWNLEREDSVLQYRPDQININILSKRISIGSRSPQISGTDGKNLDVLSCLQSLPIICEQWIESQVDGGKKKSMALMPKACALRSAVVLMDLFSSREQIQWLLDCLLELTKLCNIDDDWITMSWLCVGLSRCVAVLETSSNATLPQSSNVNKSPPSVTTNSIYGLNQSVKLVESCLCSDLTILQQSALYGAMVLLQMTVYGRSLWELPSGSLPELNNLHQMVINYLENQLILIAPPLSGRRSSLKEMSGFNASVINPNIISQAVSSGAVSLANTVSEFAVLNAVNAPLKVAGAQFNTSAAQSGLPNLLKNSQNNLIISERHSHLILAAACFYCERFPDALQDSDLLNNFVTLTKNLMQANENKVYVSPQVLLTLCRCLERILLTQRVSNLIIEQIIRVCGAFLKAYRATSYSLTSLGLFLTACYLSLTNSLQSNIVSPNFESVFHTGPTSWNPDNQLVILERMNLLWKRLTDSDLTDIYENRVLCRLIASIMIEFLSGEEVLNKTIHELLRSWPRSQFVAKSLFDMITRCLNQTDGERVIRKWTLMVLPSVTSSTPEDLSVWATTIVLLAASSSSRSYLRAIFSQCLDWLTRYERNNASMEELDTTLCLAALAFIEDMAQDRDNANISVFAKAIQCKPNIPSFRKFYQIAREKRLL